mmetsp:Transcript_43336/g.105013  ORF Transcript_43336/g.105013 Transcript_43336/m.105013 type:complete len:95 (-) Transcript_43336:248-532(-)
MYHRYLSIYLSTNQHTHTTVEPRKQTLPPRLSQYSAVQYSTVQYSHHQSSFTSHKYKQPTYINETRRDVDWIIGLLDIIRWRFVALAIISLFAI